jgi:ComF family protein
LPFEFDPGPDGLSAEAIVAPPEFKRARSAFLHNGVAKTLVSRLKFGDRPDLAVFCARLMALAGHELFGEEDGARRPVLVPVPLHRWRQWQRRYNQSSQLAQALSHHSGLEVDPLIIQRIKPTRPQIGLSAAQRTANVAGAFKMQPDAFRRLGGRSVIIVDDVITTGSTIAAMTQVLKKGGVEHIDVISFSRVVLGGDDSL